MCADGVTASLDSLLDRASAGDQGAVARLVTTVERGGDAADDVDAWAVTRAANAHVVGVTGAPGVGKSTLVGRLATHAAEDGARVAVVAVDPSSPVTHGAILGDRIRMREMDPSLFVRSMASRGHAGGLALALPGVVRVLDAVGYSTVLVETVGVGQGELDVTAVADTTVMVVAPRWGDSVQASKAGLLELADVFVVNQADRAGASETRHDLEAMLALDARDHAWTPPVLLTDALADVGTAELWAVVEEHLRYLDRTGVRVARRAARARAEVRARALHQLAAAVDRELAARHDDALTTTPLGVVARGVLDAIASRDG